MAIAESTSADRGTPSEERYRRLYLMRALRAIAIGSAAYGGTLALCGGRRTAVFRMNVAIAGLSAAASAAMYAQRPQDALAVDTFNGTPLKRASAGPVEFDYSIIIPVYNRPRELRELFEKIAGFLPGWSACGNAEIVIVDDGSTDNTLDVARELAATAPVPIRVVTQKNGGVAGARNRGFIESRARLGIVIDSDCLPYENWIPGMIGALASKPRSFVFSEVRSDRRARFPIEITPAGTLYTGASFGAAVDDYLELGGNCELFNGAYLDDVDLVLSAREHGYEILYAEGASIWHPIRHHALARVWFSGKCHRFDALLALRHGPNATVYYGNRYLGGSWYGNLPSSVLLLASAQSAAFAMASALVTRNPKDIVTVAKATALLGLGFVAGASAVGVYLKSDVRDVPNYVVGLGTFAVAASIARMQGSAKHRLALL